MDNNLNEPSIYDFLDVAQYLQARYDWRKSLDKAFTYSSWALELNIGSKTILRFILKRRRNISKKTAQVLCANLNLKPTEAEYFFNLVSFSQAKTANDRKIFGDALLLAQRKQYKQHQIEAPILAKHVYGPVLLTLLTFQDIPKDVCTLSRVLNLQVEVLQEVLGDLEEAGIVLKDSQGIYSYGQSNFKIADSPGSDHLKRYYAYWMDQAKKALDSSPETRKYRSLKFALNEEEFLDVQERVNEYTVSLLSRFHSGNIEGRKLYMYNTALFPVTEMFVPESPEDVES